MAVQTCANPATQKEASLNLVDCRKEGTEGGRTDKQDSYFASEHALFAMT